MLVLIPLVLIPLLLIPLVLGSLLRNVDASVGSAAAAGSADTDTAGAAEGEPGSEESRDRMDREGFAGQSVAGIPPEVLQAIDYAPGVSKALADAIGAGNVDLEKALSDPEFMKSIKDNPDFSLAKHAEAIGADADIVDVFRQGEIRDQERTEQGKQVATDPNRPDMDAVVSGDQEARTTGNYKNPFENTTPEYQAWFDGLSPTLQQAEVSRVQRNQTVADARKDDIEKGVASRPPRDPDPGPGPAENAQMKYLRSKGIDPDDRQAFADFEDANKDNEEYMALQRAAVAEYDNALLDRNKDTRTGQGQRTAQANQAGTATAPPSTTIGNTPSAAPPPRDLQTNSYNPINKYGVNLFEAKGPFQR